MDGVGLRKNERREIGDGEIGFFFLLGFAANGEQRNKAVTGEGGNESRKDFWKM